MAEASSGRTIGRARAWLVLAIALTAAIPQRANAQSRGRDYEPMVLGDWLFTPTLTAGGIYNDNVFSSSRDKVGRFGTTLGATGFFSRMDGLSQSQIYFTANASIYPSETKANAYTGAIGASHTREFGQDLLFNGGVEIARIQNSLQAQTLTSAGTFDLSPTDYTQFQAQASLRKTFNRLFVEGGASFVSQYYDDQTVQNADRNGWTSRVRARVGYEVAPLVSVYVEPSLDFQRYNNSFYDTDGYRVVGGLSFPRWSLFTGEVYAGYMMQRYPNATIGSQTAPTFGGSVSWLPTEDIVVTLAARQEIGLSGPTLGSAFSIVGSIPGAIPSGDPLAGTVPAPIADPTAAANAQANQVSNALIGNVSGLTVSQQLFASQGSATKTTTVSLGGRYIANQALTMGATLSYQASSPETAVSRNQDSQIYLARFNLDYSVTANWGLSATYSYARVLYDTPGMSYGQNIVSLAVNGRL